MHFGKLIVMAACAVIGAGGAGCQKELALIRIEGEISPELDARGEVYFSAYRDVFFCKRGHLQHPTRLAKTVAAKFERRDGRYVLIYDSRNAPRGGICDWRPHALVVRADFRNRVTSDITVLRLRATTVPTRFTREGPRPEPVMAARCNIERGVRNMLDCDYLERVLEATRDEVHLTLNILYEKGHKPIRN